MNTTTDDAVISMYITETDVQVVDDANQDGAVEVVVDATAIATDGGLISPPPPPSSSSRPRRRSLRQSNEPDRFVARPSLRLRGLTNADADAIYDAMKSSSTMQSSPPPPHEYSDAVSQGGSFQSKSQDNDVDVCLPVNSSTTSSDHVILSSTPETADHDVKKMPAVTQSATTSSAGTESRYPKRKRIIKSMTEDWESDFDDEDYLNDDDDDDDDDEVCLVSATAGADKVGIASSTTPTDYDDGMLDDPISSPAPTNRQCKAVSCTKHSQGNRTNGLCAHHHTQYLMSTGKIEFWTCDTCGNRMRISRRKCTNCQGGESPTTTITPANKGKKKNSSSRGSSRVMEKKEEDEEEEVTFLRSTPPAAARRRSKDSKPKMNKSRSTSRVVAEDCRYPKRGTRNSTDDETPLSSLQQQRHQKKDLPPSTPTTLPSSPGHFRPRNNTTPNSSGSNRSSSRGIDTALDYMLDFAVASSSTFSPTNKSSTHCRANSCNKFSQNKCNGFCRSITISILSRRIYAPRGRVKIVGRTI